MLNRHGSRTKHWAQMAMGQLGPLVPQLFTSQSHDQGRTFFLGFELLPLLGGCYCLDPLQMTSSSLSLPKPTYISLPI